MGAAGRWDKLRAGFIALSRCWRPSIYLSIHLHSDTIIIVLQMDWSSVGGGTKRKHGNDILIMMPLVTAALVTTAFRSESAEMWVMSVGSHRLMIIMRSCVLVNRENMKSTMDRKNLYQTLAINCLSCTFVGEDNILKWSMDSVLSWVTNKIVVHMRVSRVYKL